MTDLFNNKYKEQETSVNQSSETMATYYSQKRDSSHLKKDSDGQDNENGIRRDISKIRIVPYNTAKSSDCEQATNNQMYQTSADQPALIKAPNITTLSSLSNENSSSYTDKNSNKGDLPTVIDESENPIKIKKRSTPVSKTHSRRQAYQDLSLTSNTLQKTQIPTYQQKTICDPKQAATKRSEKSLPIFIPPKKSSTSLHGYSTAPLDYLLQNKQKPGVKQQNLSTNTNNSSSNTNSTQTQSRPPMHGHVQLLANSHDEYSSDDSDDESLFIRRPTPKLIEEKAHLSTRFNFSIPSAIYITDPNGQSYKFDLDTDTLDRNDHHEQIWDDNFNSMDTNTLSPNATPSISSSSEIVIIAPLPTTTHERHSLDSIGEEEEEDDQNHKSNIFSKELSRIEAINRSREMMFNKTIDDDDDNDDDIDDEIENKSNKNLSGRRLSDSSIQVAESLVQPTSITKTSSAVSISKQTANPPVKVSIAKYILTKLHLTSSSKDNESNMSSTVANPPKRRLVHRSSDKKRYQTH